MSTITKEWLQQEIAGMEARRDDPWLGLDEDDSNTLTALRIALASLEAEPVAYVSQSNLDALKRGHNDVFVKRTDNVARPVPLYTAPPTPVVPEEATPENIEILASTFAPRGVTYQWDRDECNAAADSWNACRAAMLQGSDGTLTNEGTITATQFKPVADLYGLTSPTGGETSFTFDAVEARDFIDGGWSCQEYVELERFQEAVSGNSPVIPDGWVACVERMPSAGEQVLAYRPDAPESNDPLIKMATYVGGSAHGHGFDCYCKPTHWMPLPAAPQQEA